MLLSSIFYHFNFVSEKKKIILISIAWNDFHWVLGFHFHEEVWRTIQFRTMKWFKPRNVLSGLFRSFVKHFELHLISSKGAKWIKFDWLNLKLGDWMFSFYPTGAFLIEMYQYRPIIIRKMSIKADFCTQYLDLLLDGNLLKQKQLL